jgi:hydroxymethylpyrimidine/phosphomethylpyrimidine kinase
VKDQVIAALASYARAAISCVGALYMSGVTDPKVLANAFVAALLAPILRGIDPKDTKFGVGAKK